MKKTIIIAFTVFCLTNSKAIFAQLTPITGLNFQQNYDYGNFNCPSFTCFTLYWSSGSSTDTLKGFKIYRDGIFWRFTNSYISCIGISPCPYNDFYDPYPFWVTVKAVYNVDSVESIANDSIYVLGGMTNISEVNKNTSLIVKNPVKTNENISILIPNNESKNCQIKVISQNGQLIKEYSMKNISNKIINISTNQMCKGIYFINVQIDKAVLTNQLIIE